jgi:hypothetical protein
MTLCNAINPFWDQNIMDLINGIKESVPDQTMPTLAKQIAAILSLVYLMVRAYAMILGEGRFEVMPLFRPFLICLAIINFSLLIEILSFPGEAATTDSEAKFIANAQIVDQDMDNKQALNDTLFNRLIENTNELKQLFGGTKSEDMGTGEAALNWLSGGAYETLSNMQAYIVVYEQLLWVKLSMWMQGFVMWLVMGIFKGICYCLFFLQVLLIYVLTTLGPISLGFSVAGPFKDAWVQWAAKYISVSFYSTIGYIVLNLSFAILHYGFQQEIDRLNQVLAQSDVREQFIASVSHIDNFVGYLFIALITALAGIISTPVISTWIVQTAGTGNVFFGAAVNTARSVGGAAAGKLGA